MQNDDLASLLAQLRESQDPQFRPPVPAPAPPPPTQSELDSLLASLNARRSLSALTFPESLPLLQSLGANDAFLEALTDLRREQDELELMMRDERNRLEGEGKRGGIRCAHSAARCSCRRADDRAQPTRTDAAVKGVGPEGAREVDTATGRAEAQAGGSECAEQSFYKDQLTGGSTTAASADLYADERPHRPQEAGARDGRPRRLPRRRVSCWRRPKLG